MSPERPRRPGQGGGGGPSSGLVSQDEITAATLNVISLRSRALDRAEARAVDAVLELAGEAMAALADVLAGEVDAIYTSHMLVNRAVRLTLDHRLRTIA